MYYDIHWRKQWSCLKKTMPSTSCFAGSFLFLSALTHSLGLGFSQQATKTVFLLSPLTQWDLINMAEILQTAFSISVFFHENSIVLIKISPKRVSEGVQLTISCHLGDSLAPNQCQPTSWSTLDQDPHIIRTQLRSDICITKTVQHWSRWWLLTCLALSH